MSLVPRSLFGRTLLVLAAGLVLADIASQLVNFFDRGSGVYRLGAQQTALRIAQTARILNRLAPAQRTAVIDEMNGSSFNVALADARIDVGAGFAEHDRYERALSDLIKHYLRSDWNTSVQITSLGRTRRPRNYEAIDTGAFEQWLARHLYYVLAGTYSIVSQIRLEDGKWAVFYARMPQEPLSRLESLLPRLLLNLAIVMLLGAAAVATITRSLEGLARAAERVGVEPEGAPLPEVGPSEVRSVIHAFNRMRLQLRSYLLERARMLGRHLARPADPDHPPAPARRDDPGPREPQEVRARPGRDGGDRRLHARVLQDPGQRAAAPAGRRRRAGRQPVRGPGRRRGRRDDARRARSPYPSHPQALRRCLDNLVENALRYGGRARIAIEDDAASLRITVSDDGPGIPEADLERVFEPFFRLEESRNRDSGGTGLGLAIARNIARWHGGDIHLRNAPGGKGLIAELVLPRSAAHAAA